MILGFISGDM